MGSGGGDGGGMFCVEGEGTSVLVYSSIVSPCAVSALGRPH